MADEKKKDAKAKVPRRAKKDAYKVEDGKVTRTRKHCPKCGPGVFMAEHDNRTTCGKCCYTEFKKK
jgi:small subunit ribosomal protein S27Ae